MNPARTEGEPPRTLAAQNDTELNQVFGRCSRGWASRSDHLALLVGLVGLVDAGQRPVEVGRGRVRGAPSLPASVVVRGWTGGSRRRRSGSSAAGADGSGAAIGRWIPVMRGYLCVVPAHLLVSRDVGVSCLESRISDRIPLRQQVVSSRAGVSWMLG